MNELFFGLSFPRTLNNSFEVVFLHISEMRAGDMDSGCKQHFNFKGRGVLNTIYDSTLHS